MTRLMTRLSLAALLFTVPGAAMADGGGFDRDIFDRWVTARAGTGEPVYWYSEGDVKAYPSGEVLVRMEGFDAARLHRPDPDSDTAYQLSRKIYVFRDPKTNEILRTFNGAPVQVVKFPYQYMTYTLDGDRLITWVEQGAGESYLKIGPGTDIRARQLGETLVFTAPLYLTVEGPPSVSRSIFENYDFFIQPEAEDPREQYQLSWLRYGDRGGFSDGPTITHMVSWRVDSFDELPESIASFVREEAPLWLEPPRDVEEIRALQAASAE